MVVGVDTGGTFTDFIALIPDGRVFAHKTLSTPDDPGAAVLKGLDELMARLQKEVGSVRPGRFVHGSTVATNAVLERKGTKTALITTEGFKDLLHIGRQSRNDLYDLTPRPKPSLIQQEHTFEVKERLDVSGEVVHPLDEASLEQVAQKLREAGIESVAVVFLHSFVNSEHEARVANVLRDKGFYVSASHEILPEHREFERASTTALNAYVAPLMTRYLQRLDESLSSRGIRSMRVMQSSGGVTDPTDAGRHAVHTLFSGPAGGVVGALRAGRDVNMSKLITFDMGGTSSDVSLLPDEFSVTTESEIEGYPVRVPVLDIHTVGAGGGSIAQIDAGGALRVGPESAGASPGPACYGLGGQNLTVTDANLLLGRLPKKWFMGGEMSIDYEAAQKAGIRLAQALGTSLNDAAYGVIRVVNSNMERAIKVISVERGFDPRDFTLVSFGGAGSLHAAELAASLSIPRVLVPVNPGVLSAFGMTVADVVKTSVQGIVGPLDHQRLQEAQTIAAKLREEGYRALAFEGVEPQNQQVHLYVDLRYQGQSFELVIPFSDLPDMDPEAALKELTNAFSAAHERAYGYADPLEPIEIVAVRVRAVGRLVTSGPMPMDAKGNKLPDPVAETKTRFAQGVESTPIYERWMLPADSEIVGPALIVEKHATILLTPGDVGRVLPTGALSISLA